MKKIIVIFLMAVFLVGCGREMTISGQNYKTYGLIDRDEVKNPMMKYRLIVGNVIWGILLAETIIAPVYFFGFSLYEPVGLEK